jgi:hypothetical protein
MQWICVEWWHIRIVSGIKKIDMITRKLKKSHCVMFLSEFMLICTRSGWGHIVFSYNEWNVKTTMNEYLTKLRQRICARWGTVQHQTKPKVFYFVALTIHGNFHVCWASRLIGVIRSFDVAASTYVFQIESKLSIISTSQNNIKHCIIDTFINLTMYLCNMWN